MNNDFQTYAPVEAPAIQNWQQSLVLPRPKRLLGRMGSGIQQMKADKFNEYKAVPLSPTYVPKYSTLKINIKGPEGPVSINYPNRNFTIKPYASTGSCE